MLSIAELSSCNRDYVTRKAVPFYCPTFYRKSLVTPTFDSTAALASSPVHPSFPSSFSPVPSPTPAAGSNVPASLPLQAQKLTSADVINMTVVCLEGTTRRVMTTQDFKPFENRE